MAKLHFYYSAMNAGKTTTLLQSNHNYNERGMETLLFTPAIDDRYAEGVMASRIGLKAEATPFTKSFNFFEFAKEHIDNTGKKPSCILIDEAQFLSKDQVYQLTQIITDLGIPTLTYGLRSDFLGEPFEGSLYLLAWAEELNEIKTVCHCGSKATMNARLDEKGKMVSEGNQVEIGGNDRYIALCRKHYMNGITTSSSETLEKKSSDEAA
jgi:thymidine kinase